MAKYDWLIVGAGFSGAVFANELKKRGKSVLVLDKRNHIGGNCYTSRIEGINVHQYGAHIFHTNEERAWKLVNEHTTMNQYNHQVIVNYEGNIYTFPINLKTLNEIDPNIRTPDEAQDYLDQFKDQEFEEDNFETYCLKTVGPDIYNIFLKGYTQKQWGREPKTLPSSIIKRIPVRTNFDTTYFNNAKYCGMPANGYTEIFESLLKDVDLVLNVDYLDDREGWDLRVDKVLYTGALDEFFDWKFGELEWRSLRFENKLIKVKDYQGVSVMNYTHEAIPFTRILEHKHFSKDESDYTYVTREYPADWKRGEVPYYPIGGPKNKELWKKYADKFDAQPGFYRAGRLANYTYIDMDKTIMLTLELFDKLEKEGKI